LRKIADRLLREEVVLVVLGRRAVLRGSLSALDDRYKGRFRRVMYDETLAHKSRRARNIFLMPSRYDPAV